MFVKCTTALYTVRRHIRTRMLLKSWERERREKSRKYEELGKNEKRLLVISKIMFDRKMGGNFEDRRKNI